MRRIRHFPYSLIVNKQSYPKASNIKFININQICVLCHVTLSCDEPFFIQMINV
jgi:hypothetical protein